MTDTGKDTLNEKLLDAAKACVAALDNWVKGFGKVDDVEDYVLKTSVVGKVYAMSKVIDEIEKRDK